MHEAKTQLSRLAERAANGEEITIARNGLPVAKLVAVPASKKRELGFAKGEIWIGDDFDDPLPDEILAAFEGRAD